MDRRLDRRSEYGMSKKSREIFYLSVLVLSAGVLIYGLGDALFPLLISAFFAYLMLPVIQRMQKRGMNKQMAVSTALLIVLLSVVLLFSLFVPMLVRDLKYFIVDLPTIAETAILKVDAIL